MDNDVEVKLEAGPVAMSVGAKGVATALAKTFVDIASPLSELIGYVGDSIRIFRQENVAAAIIASDIKMRKLGMKVVAPRPAFIIQYIENVGPAYDDPQLKDMWENLLVSASEGDSAEKTFYIDILKRMSAEDAILFDEICFRPISGLGFASGLSEMPIERRNDSTMWVLNKNVDSEDFIDIAARLIQREEACGSAVFAIRVWSQFRGANEFIYSRGGHPIDRLEARFDRLKGLGLLQFNDHHKVLGFGREISVSNAYLTHVGVGLFYSTHDPRYRKVLHSRGKGAWMDGGNIDRFEDKIRSDEVLGRIKNSETFLQGIVHYRQR